jgi:flagellar biosynthesis chaperone FliJ
LLKLIERVDVDMERARAAQKQAKQRLLEAEIALFKMQSMVDKDARAVAAHRRRLEQRQLDAMGIAQFNLRQAASPAPASGNSAA